MVWDSLYCILKVSSTECKFQREETHFFSSIKCSKWFQKQEYFEKASMKHAIHYYFFSKQNILCIEKKYPDFLFITHHLVIEAIEYLFIA